MAGKNYEKESAEQLNEIGEGVRAPPTCQMCGAEGRRAWMRPNGDRTCKVCHPVGEAYLIQNGTPLYLDPVVIDRTEVSVTLDENISCRIESAIHYLQAVRAYVVYHDDLAARSIIDMSLEILDG